MHPVEAHLHFIVAQRRNARERLQQILHELNLQELEGRFLGPQSS